MTADLADRVRSLERSRARCRAVAAAGFAAALGMLLAGAAQPGPPQAVTATAFRLVDAKGALRGSFELEEGEHPSLALLDAQGRKRWHALLKNDEVFTYLRDNSGRGRITHAVDRADHPHFLVHDKGNKPRLHAAVADSGAPSLVFIHVDGTMPAGVGVHADGRGWVLPAPAEPGKDK